MKSVDNVANDVPLLIQPWLKVYHAIPKLYIPGLGPEGRLDISFMLFSAVVFCTCRFVILYILQNYFDWPDSSSTQYAKSCDAAASLAGVCHSSLLIPLLAVLLWTQPYLPSGHILKDFDTNWYPHAVSLALQMCTGYMIYDGILNIFLIRYNSTTQTFDLKHDDYMYLGHHVATIFYMTTCRILGAGHVSAFGCMFWGELTNPIFNSYLVAQLAKEIMISSPEQQGAELIKWVETLCAVAFLPIRGLIAPIVLGLHCCYDLLFSKRAQQYIPLGFRISFSIMIWIVIVGSIPYLFSFVDILKKHWGTGKNIVDKEL